MPRRLRPALLGAALSLVMLTGPVASEPAELTLSFSAAGDFSGSTAAQSVFSLIGSLDNDLHLALGDLSYGATGAEESWCALVKQGVGEGYPFELVAGNHESNGQNGNINDFSACLPNQLPGVHGTYGRQYFVDVPQGAPLARFVMISPGLPFNDGTWSYEPGTARHAWTAAAIDGARAAGIPWVVVAAHKPCLSVGQYSCELGAGLHTMLLDKRVDLVLHGHEHVYQRTKQLATGAGCTAVTPGSYDPDCVVDADTELAKGAGTVFATAGTGGISPRDVFPADPEAGYFAAWSGLNANPTYGVLQLTATTDRLTAAFRRAAGGTFTDGFTISRGVPGGNQPPTAAFTDSCTGLTCTFSASTSTDADGTIVAYSWSYGDGATGTGAEVSHTYAAQGSYPVTLTVTDDAGATDTETRTVSLTAPPAPTTIARDLFERTVSNGLGSAEVGGPWAFTTSSANFAVTGGVATIRHPAGTGPFTTLPQAVTPAVDASVTIAPDKQATGSGLYVSLLGRRVPGSGDYRAKVRFQSTGAVAFGLMRASATGAETALAGEATVPGLTFAPGDRLRVRLEVTGSSPTTLRAKIWKVGTAEPAAWMRTAADATAALQTSGHVGLYSYLSSAATNAPITVAVDDLLAVAP